jgi:beta-lactamase class A
MILALLFAVATAAPAVDATIGYSAMNLESGARVSQLGTERFPMGSVYKFPIALEVLRLVDDGTLTLEQAVRIQPADFSTGWSPLRDAADGKAVTHSIASLLQFLLRDSDNTACDVLLGVVGGPIAITRRMRELGIREVRVDRTERAIADDLHAVDGIANYWIDPRDTATPDALVDLLNKFFRNEVGLSRSSHRLALKLMTETTTGPKRIKASLPNGATLAHKTGTMPGVVNDIGIITSPDGKRHLLIAILTKARKTSSEEDVEAAIAMTARELYDRLMPEAASAGASTTGGSR